jgi:hypothetical protein
MTTRNLGGMIFDAIKEGYRSNTCNNGCVYGLMIAPLFMPFNQRTHYVTLAWQDDSDVRRAVFRMSKSDYRGFMESVSKASGQPSKDLAEEQKKTRRELKRQLRSAAAVSLEHEVALGGIVLKPRVYKVLLAESLNGGSEVSFFAGDKKALTLPVDIAAGGAAARAAVAYQQLETGDWTVAEIRIPGKVLSFPSAEPTPADSSGDITEDREY